MSESEKKFPYVPVIVAIITGVFTLLAACVGLALPFMERLAQPGPTLTIPVEAQANTLTPLRPTYTPVLPPDTPVPPILTPQPIYTPVPPTDTPAPAIFTPQPIPVSDTGEFKGVGESYEANGISLALMEYDIKSDGSIWLKFIVANQRNQKVLLRYQNKYFSVIDDTEKAYPQDEDSLLDIKQAELSPGKSLEITGHPYAGDLYNYISYFHGKVPEQASYLIVKVSQFADLRDMQWRIPLNAQLPSPQSPVPGTQQPLLEGFSANGITVLLSDYTIESDGAIGLKFLVQNEGNNAVLLRYQNKYFEVQDDLGNKYGQDQNHLVEPKQMLLSPGKSLEITGHPYAGDLYNYISYFHGKVPEQASYLIVKVSQFADLRDVQWRIPLNAQLSSPQSPAPGTQQPLLEGFSANGITVLLSDYTIESDGAIQLKFLVQNEGNNAVLLRYQNKYFEVQDDLGNKYGQDQDHLVEPKQMLLSPGKSLEITGHPYAGDLYNYISYFHGKVPEEADYLIVKVSQFADLRDIQWRIPLK